jgi:hypothetical protein
VKEPVYKANARKDIRYIYPEALKSTIKDTSLGMIVDFLSMAFRESFKEANQLQDITDQQGLHSVTSQYINSPDSKLSQTRKVLDSILEKQRHQVKKSIFTSSRVTPPPAKAQPVTPQVPQPTPAESPLQKLKGIWQNTIRKNIPLPDLNQWDNIDEGENNFYTVHITNNQVIYPQQQQPLGFTDPNVINKAMQKYLNTAKTEEQLPQSKYNQWQQAKQNSMRNNPNLVANANLKSSKSIQEDVPLHHANLKVDLPKIERHDIFDAQPIIKIDETQTSGKNILEFLDMRIHNQKEYLRRF